MVPVDLKTLSVLPVIVIVYENDYHKYQQLL